MESSHIYLFTDPLVELELEKAIDIVRNPKIDICKLIFSPGRSNKDDSVEDFNEMKLSQLFDVMRHYPGRVRSIGINATRCEQSQNESRFLECFYDHWISHPKNNYRYSCTFEGVLAKDSCPNLKQKMTAAIRSGGRWITAITFHAEKRRPRVQNRDVVQSVLEATLDDT